MIVQLFADVVTGAVEVVAILELKRIRRIVEQFVEVPEDRMGMHEYFLSYGFHAHIPPCCTYT